MRHRHSLLSASAAFALSVLAVVACSGSSSSSGFGDNGGSSSGGTTGGSSGGGTGALGDGGNGGGNFGCNLTDAGNTTGGCQPDPANYDIPGNNCDDDGDGQVDNVTVCDQTLAAGGDAMAFAQAIGLCQQATGNKWGVVSASYQKGYNVAQPPNDAQHGILPKFGSVIVPREGKMLGVLSSGSATENDTDNGPAFKGAKNGMQSGGLFSSGGPAPAGYPKAAAGCPGALGVNDMIDVKLTIKVPANAQGVQFDFDFWSGEWPEYVCTEFNDSFVAFLTSQAFNGGKADNISFDMNNNPVSVNNGFFDRCTPNTTTGCSGTTTKTAACPGGPAELGGTGFEDNGTYCTNPSTGGGATGWLSTKAPVKAGETITLEFMIWDTGDNSWDSSVLIDNFQWQPGPTTTGTGRPPPK